MFYVNINGSFYDEAHAKISVFDHGFLYGDGVFEGIRIYNKTIFKLEEHLDRLYDSATAIKMGIPLTKEQFHKEIIRTCQKNSITSGYIRVLATRGIGDLSLNPYICKNQSYVIIAREVDPLLGTKSIEHGVDVITTSVRRMSSSAIPIRAKTMSYINSILAVAHALDLGKQEAIMFGEHGYITEGSGDNIFIIKNGIVKTPATHLGILEGITRNTIIEICKKNGYQVEEACLTSYDLTTADEVFITGTLAEIVPVKSIDGKQVGSSSPGKITKEIAACFRIVAQQDGAKYQ